MNDPPTEGRVLAIDYGSRRVGLAMSDPLRILASGLGTETNDAGLPGRLAGIVRENGVALVVVGMPYAPDGGLGRKGEEVTAFMERLRALLPVEVTSWDESFSSRRAQESLIEGGMKKKRRQEKGRIDEMAARLLLQEYLENHPHS